MRRSARSLDAALLPAVRLFRAVRLPESFVLRPMLSAGLPASLPNRLSAGLSDSGVCAGLSDSGVCTGLSGSGVCAGLSDGLPANLFDAGDSVGFGGQPL